MAAAMEMFHVQHTQGHVLCCLCGTSIPPNPSNMCVACIRTQVDITEGIQKQVTVLFCKECERWLQPPKNWTRAKLESKELLTFCIKRVRNLNKVKLIDAGFIWTEPHSKRLKLKLTIQKEVFNGAILQQTFVVEFVVEDHMCDSCSRAAANPDQWIAKVQLRQKVDHKRTFFFLEQLILKHGADANTINIKQIHDGVDFYYSNRSHALKFVDFLTSVVPIRQRADKQLVSHDSHSMTYNYRFTFSVEIVPVCKDDLVLLPQKVANALGNVGPLVICTRVSNTLQLLDPLTMRLVYQDANQYWRAPYRPLIVSKQLVEYVVLDIEPVSDNNGATGGSGRERYVLADATVARASDFGKNDVIFQTRTHLGHLLQAGDLALGYDCYAANTNADSELEKFKGFQLPDVVLIKKSYEEKRKKRRGRGRAWKLRQLPMEVEATTKDDDKARVDYERFLEELEEDPEMRAKVALYKDPTYVERPREEDTMTETDGEEPPQVPLEELLDELTLDEGDGDEEMEG